MNVNYYLHLLIFAGEADVGRDNGETPGRIQYGRNYG